MIHLISRTWKRSNRSEKIEGILKVLNRSGTAEAKYFKGRSNVISYYLWKGKPQPVNEDDEWNYVRITYQEKVALELLELRVHLINSTPEFGGHFFDEHFTEQENQHIIDALNGAGIITLRASLTKGRKLLLSFTIVFLLFAALVFLIGGHYGDSVLYCLISVLHLCCAFLLIVYFAWVSNSSSTAYRKSS